MEFFIQISALRFLSFQDLIKLLCLIRLNIGSRNRNNLICICLYNSAYTCNRIGNRIGRLHHTHMCVSTKHFSGIPGMRSDHRDFFPFCRNRQYAVIFQQYHGFSGRPQGSVPVCFLHYKSMKLFSFQRIGIFK